MFVNQYTRLIKLLSNAYRSKIIKDTINIFILEQGSAAYDDERARSSLWAILQ